MQYQQQEIKDHGFAPSFSIYSSNSITSRALSKVIHEEGVTRYYNNLDVDSDDFEFSLVLSDQEDSVKDSSSSSYSSSEADELEIPRLKTKCKKSSSTGTGSKRWIFRYLLRRSNNECKEAKKVDSPKHKRNSVEESKFGARFKAQSPVHEQFYVQRRAENEVGKRRSYLPYRKDLVGLFANVNGMGKMLSF